MIGLGTMGIGAGDGNSSSSFSNLSALAPPFTVHRLNPNPNLNPNFQYPESAYSVEPFSHTWQYPTPSAPGSELVIGSTCVGSVPLSNSYQFSASTSVCPPSTHWSGLSPGGQTSGDTFAYGGGIDPYYTPYVPPKVGEHSPLVEDDGPRYGTAHSCGLGVSSQTDYVQSLYDLDYKPHWGDSLGFDYGKRAKRLDADGNLLSEKSEVGDSHIFNNGLNPGTHSIEYRNTFKGDNGVSYEVFNQAYDTDTTGTLGVHGHMEEKLCLERNSSFLPHVSSKMPIKGSSSAYPESHSCVLSHDMPYNFANYQHLCSTHENIVGSTDSPFTCPVSIVRSPPAVVIRQPPAVNGTFGQSVVSHTPTRSDSVIGAQRGHSDHSSFSKRKDLGKKSSSEIEGNSFDTEFHLPKQGNDQISISSTLLKELSSPLHAKDTFDHKINTGFGSQFPNTTVSDGFDCVQVVTSTVESSDFVDHLNFAVDSPCWKGAPFPQFSSIDLEAGTSNHVKRKMDDYYGFDHEVRQNFQSIVDPIKTSSERASEANKNADNGIARNGIALTLEGFLNAVCPSGQETSSNASIPGMRTSTMTSSLGVKTSNESIVSRKEHALPNDLKSSFDMKILDKKYFSGEEDSGMALNDVSEGGVIAVDAAEKVLASPSSQEDRSELSTLRPNPKLDVPTVIKAMHNLSELLLVHLSNDRCTLKEEYTETLKHIKSNLNSCMSKKIVQATNEPKQNNPVGNMSKKLWESPSVGTNSGSPHKTDGTKDSTDQLDCWDMRAGKRNCSLPTKKDEKSSVFSPLGDNFIVTKDDDMSEAIKKVLDQNFSFNEEMQSETLLFKSLWLEAEAKLCSISYKARFERMKIEMEKLKSKGPKEIEDAAKMMSMVSISPDQCTASKRVAEAHDGTIPKNPITQNSSLSTTSGCTEEVDSSVMTRFNILKSRDDNLKFVNVEEEQSPDIVDGDSASSILARFSILKSREDNMKSINVEKEQSTDFVDGRSASPVMARFNILKSREDKLKSLNVEEEQSPDTVGGDSANSVMARFNILKSREDSLKSINMEEEQQPEKGDFYFTGKKYQVLGIRDEPEDEIIKVALRPHFMNQTGCSSEGEFGSCIDGFVYESLEELNFFASYDSVIPSIDNSRMMNQHYPGWRDTSSSDWEHVLKDDVAWNNL